MDLFPSERLKNAKRIPYSAWPGFLGALILLAASIHADTSMLPRMVNHAYASGNFVFNGGFEDFQNGTSDLRYPTGWRDEANASIGSGCYARSPKEGMCFGVATYNSSSESGKRGPTYEIPASNPAYSTLIAKSVDVYAWVRKGSPSSPTHVSISFDNNPNPLTITLGDDWALVHYHVDALQPGIGEGLVLRFSGIESSTDLLSYDIDDVVLRLSGEYTDQLHSHTVADKSGRVIQTQSIADGAAGRDIVALSSEYDANGRPLKTYLPVLEHQTSTPDLDLVVPLSKANSAYSATPPTGLDGIADAGGKAYTEESYEPDPEAAVLKEGLPGANYALSSNHVAQTTIKASNTLAPPNASTPEVPPASDAPNYQYQYTRGKNTGERVVEWKDFRDRSVQQVNYLGQTAIQTKWNYDARGNVVSVENPANTENGGSPVGNMTYKYDQENHLIEENSPDFGKIKYAYDYSGRLRATQDARQALSGEFTVMIFDSFGRQIKTGIATGDFEALIADRVNNLDIADWPTRNSDEDWGFLPEIETFYDSYANIPTNLSFTRPAGTDCSFCKGRTVATVNYNRALESSYPNLADRTISTVFDYDYRGNITTQYEYDGFVTNVGSKMQEVSSSYDLLGRLRERTVFKNASSQEISTVHSFEYNDLGRLQDVKDGAGLTLAQYDYWPDGKVRSVKIGGGSLLKVDYTYHINGGIKSILATDIHNSTPVQVYSEDLKYDDLSPSEADLNQFNGNIARLTYSIRKLGNGSKVQTYKYDDLNRLLEVVSDNDNNLQAEKYGYYYDGRIKMQKRSGQQYSDPAPYRYKSNTNQLNCVEEFLSSRPAEQIDRTCASHGGETYVYDASGNLIQDKARDIFIEYDWRNYPVRIMSGGNQEVMAYDAGGNRATKITAIGSGKYLDAIIAGSAVSPNPDRYYFTDLEDAYQAGIAAISASDRTDPVTIYAAYESSNPTFEPPSGTEFKPLKNKSGQTVDLILVGVENSSPEYQAMALEREILDPIGMTHYFSGLKEIREAPGETPKEINNLFGVGLIGRVRSDGAKEYYVTNHLGSTVASLPASGYTDESDVFAREYFANGLPVNDVRTPESITETFTGKERDEGSGLYYFGARYFDADLAMWTSPDPARYFNSSYAYTGNGFNPINAIDSRGMAPHIFYDPDFEKEANWDAENLTKEYGEDAVLHEVRTMDDFAAAWKEVQADKSLDAISLRFHGRGDAMWSDHGDFSLTSLTEGMAVTGTTSISIIDLPVVHPTRIDVYSCNAASRVGNINLVGAPTVEGAINVQAALHQHFGVPVSAWSGSVKFGPWWRALTNDYSTRLARDQGSWIGPGKPKGRVLMK